MMDDNELIAGEQRLRACQSLGWQTIPARRWPDLTEAERREIELAENLDRKDLTAYERSRNLVALAETAAEVDRQEFRTDAVRNSNGGRPSEPGSLRRVSERIDVPVNTIKTARQHVAAIDTYPELTPLPQREAIATAAILDAMPEKRREEARVGLMPPVADVAYEIADSAGKAELDRLRYLKRLNATLGHVAALASQYDPADVVTVADDATLTLIDAAASPLPSTTL